MGTGRNPIYNAIGRVRARGNDLKTMHLTVKIKSALHLIPALVAWGALMPSTAGAQTPKKVYTLFTGNDISVDMAKGLFPVRDVNGSSWVVVINGQEQVVSGAVGPINLKITPSIKLTESSATVSGFKREPSYTFANDPAVKLTKNLSSAASVSASYQAASNQANAVDPLTVTSASASGSGTTVAANVMGQNTAGDISQSAAAGVAASLDLQGKQEAVGYDAMTVEFEIASAKPIPAPYIVTMTRFHPRGSVPGTIQSLVFAKALDPIDAKASKVKFSEEGFPFDYEVVDFQMHLYNAGIEIPTNLLEKREEMTPDQAFDYIKKTYLEAHKSDTMHATPVMAELPSDLGGLVASGKYAETVYVKVSKDGLADEAFSDIGCTTKIEDPYLDSLVKCIRFKPALTRGVTVEGVALLNFSKMRI